MVKKAYCDFERYKTFKRGLHEAAFELIEIPHVRQSGKNSANIRMVVDALDLCYTKSPVDTFVIISGDSDFSPLVSKLRENDKTVIGVGVKMSTSDLFISNCDEFLYYDDFVRVEPAKKRPSVAASEPAAKTGKDHGPSIDGALDLLEEKPLKRCGPSEARIIRSEAHSRSRRCKRQNPGFNERAHGFHAFNELLLEAQKRGPLKLERDKQVGATSSTRSTERLIQVVGSVLLNFSIADLLQIAPDKLIEADRVARRWNSFPTPGTDVAAFTVIMNAPPRIMAVDNEPSVTLSLRFRLCPGRAMK